jgi:cell division protein FtsL
LLEEVQYHQVNAVAVAVADTLPQEQLLILLLVVLVVLVAVVVVVLVHQVVP